MTGAELLLEPELARDDFAAGLADRLTGVECIEPGPLADLFVMAGGASDRSTMLRHVLQNFLLARTFDHARRHTSYYRRTEYRAFAPAPTAVEPDLDAVPVLTRDTVATQPHDFLADNVTVRSLCHTSGTTGTPLDLYKSHEEIRFLQDYYGQLIRPAVRALATFGSRPLVLTLPNVNHGVPVPMPALGMTFVSGVTDDTLIRDARRVLEQTFHIPGHNSRISMLTGLPHHVLLLTSYLFEQGVDPRTLNLQSVTITGGFLSMNWIRFLEESWGCPVNDRFTLTEAIGGASRLPGTDTFQLDPHLVGEVVDPDTHRRVPAGPGLLLLTNLYPFVQMQPLLRYTVGDLVSRVPGPGPLRFRFLGKERNCVSRQVGSARQWLLFSTSLNELVSQFADVNVYEWFSNVRAVHDRTIGSLPVLAVSTHPQGTDRMTIRISIELRYAPHTRRARVEEIRTAIVRGLCECPGTSLASALDAGEVDLDVCFVGPGALDAPLVIKI